ncbi:amino acid ABC transporter permease [Anoxybacterium hadale]|uniref:Amino acid ABC transporter permease n=1 Tax=Anoxybacterium hadale TaxID=3408580 RepID=A0ACD1AA38_9FIRM|nr:amino acid ABC transporter permease [Clostridiales bacterium]
MGPSAPQNSWEWIVLFLDQYGSAFAKGAVLTLQIAVISTLIGCIIGFVVGMIQTIEMGKSDPLWKRITLKIVNILLAVYVEVFRGTPMMVQAMVVYYGSDALFGLNLNPILAGYIVVSVNTGAYMAETVRGGIMSVSNGQIEAAKALGFRHTATMVNIILPQALLNILPQIGNNLIINIKDTSVLNVIACSELFFTTKSVTGTYWRFFEPFLIACVIYLFMTFTLSRLLRLMEKKLQGPRSYQLVTDFMDDTYGNGSAVIDMKKGFERRR